MMVILESVNYSKFIKKIKLQSQKLQVELENAEEQRTQEAEKRAETIRQLKCDLHQIEQYAQESSKRVTSEVEKVKLKCLQKIF